MQVIQELLANVPSEQIKTYESYLQVHLKLLMTSINKAKVQNNTDINIKKNQCISKCYSRQLNALGVASNTSQLNQNVDIEEVHAAVQQIRQCKQKCGQEKKAVKKYLDDINYYSMLKMKRCMKDCHRIPIGNNPKQVSDNEEHSIRDYQYYSAEFNQCLWGCYNKLDRRYKIYWQQQKDLVRQPHKEK